MHIERRQYANRFNQSEEKDKQDIRKLDKNYNYCTHCLLVKVRKINDNQTKSVQNESIQNTNEEMTLCYYLDVYQRSLDAKRRE